MVTLEATLSYQENCDYLPSEMVQEFEVKQQEVDITSIITIENFDNRDEEVASIGYKTQTFKNGETLDGNRPFYPYYNDELLIEALITFTHENIRYNDINIYFFNEYEDRTTLDPDDSDHIILQNAQLDNQGKVGVKFLPHTNGYFVIEYNETKFFKRKVVEHKIELYQIPVKTTIKPLESELPLFIHREEAVDLMASVRDIYGKRPKDGVITFLSYDIHENESGSPISNRGDMRIIGNPIMLEDGETVYYEPPSQMVNEDKDKYPVASMGDVIKTPDEYDEDWTHYTYDRKASSGFISYSPKQFLVNGKNIEFIRAVYNYDNIKYGQSWRYYEDHSAWTRISVLIPGRINIAIRNESHENPAEIREDGLYEFKMKNDDGQSDKIKIGAQALDENGNSLSSNIDKFNFKISRVNWTKNDGVVAYGDSYIIKSSKSPCQVDASELGPGIYSVEAYTNFKDFYKNSNDIPSNERYYDSLESEKGYFEIMPETPENENTGAGGSSEIIENPTVKITNFKITKSIYKGEINATIAANGFSKSVNIITTISRAENNSWNNIATDNRTVTNKNSSFTLNQKNMKAGEYRIDTICTDSGNNDSKTFTINKADLVPKKLETQAITGKQNINMIVNTNGTIDDIQKELFTITKNPCLEVGRKLSVKTSEDYTVLDDTSQGIEIDDEEFTIHSYEVWEPVMGKAYLNDGWINNTKWTIEFNIQDTGGFNSPSELILIRDIDEATYENQLKRCIAIQTNGRIFTCDNDKNQTTITDINDENLIPNNTDKKLHFTITKNNNDYEIKILNTDTGNTTIINFISNVLNNSNELHLWFSCISNDKGRYVLSNIKHKYYEDNILPINKFVKSNNSLTIGSNNILFLDTIKYNIEISYDGDENYNTLPLTNSLTIKGTTVNGSFSQINSNTFKINNNGNNNQVIIGVLQAISSTKEIRIPIITNIDGTFTINNINNWNSYVEFNFFKNPKDINLLNILANTNNVYDDLVNYYNNTTWKINDYEERYYETLQGNVNNANILYNQYIENHTQVLFTVYNDETIH